MLKNSSSFFIYVRSFAIQSITLFDNLINQDINKPCVIFSPNATYEGKYRRTSRLDFPSCRLMAVDDEADIIFTSREGT
jgi:hypothetical protein